MEGLEWKIALYLKHASAVRSKCDRDSFDRGNSLFSLCKRGNCYLRCLRNQDVSLLVAFLILARKEQASICAKWIELRFVLLPRTQNPWYCHRGHSARRDS